MATDTPENGLSTPVKTQYMQDINDSLFEFLRLFVGDIIHISFLIAKYTDIRFSLLLTGICCFNYFTVAYHVGFDKTSYSKNSWGESDKVIKKAIHLCPIFGDKNLRSLK